jgi:hypothetical protein
LDLSHWFHLVLCKVTATYQDHESKQEGTLENVPCATKFGSSDNRSGGQAILATETVYTSGGIDDLLLTGVKRMGLARNLHFNQGIFFAVGPFYRIFGLNGGFSQKCKIRGNILKNHLSIIRMNAFLHALEPLEFCWKIAPRGACGTKIA